MIRITKTNSFYFSLMSAYPPPVVEQVSNDTSSLVWRWLEVTVDGLPSITCPTIGLDANGSTGLTKCSESGFHTIVDDEHIGTAPPAKENRNGTRLRKFRNHANMAAINYFLMVATHTPRLMDGGHQKSTTYLRQLSNYH